MTTDWGAVVIFEAGRFNPPIFGQDLCLMAGKRAAAEYRQRTLDVFEIEVDVQSECRLLEPDDTSTQ
jgi:hypothetical protein